VKLEGTVDALHGRGDLRARFERFPIDTGQAAVTLLATGTAELHAEPRGEGLAFTARGSGSYRRRGGGETLPGGRFDLEARGTQEAGRTDARFEIELHDRGQASRVLLDAGDAAEPVPTTLIRGELVVPRGGKPRLTADVAAR
jgi:hypothetical protein